MIDDTGMPKVRKSRSEMVSSVLKMLKPGVNTYDYFNYKGRFGVMSFPKVVNVEAPLVSFIDRFENPEWYLERAYDLIVAKNTVETLDVSVRKMDNQVVRLYQQCPLFRPAVEFVKSKFEVALTQPGMNISEAFQSMDMNKAAGFVLKQNGYKKKYQVVSSGIYQDFLKPDIMKEIPYWSACGKEREFLYRTDFVLNKKQRTFIIEPFELLLHHKLIYGKQNEGMKNFWWSAYGFNPYGGGVGYMANMLLRHKRFTMFDVIRYDRIFPHMREVFEVKNEFLADNPFKQWVTDNCCCSHVVLPNGDLIEKDWGNNSGSGSTTVDNIIGMAICIVHALMRVGVAESEIDEYVTAFLYGDDVVMSDDVNISDALWAANLEETFALYGFKFDPIVVSHSLSDMSFLGFGFSKHDYCYIPKYELGVLCFSFMHNHNKMDTFSEICKMGSIMLMSAGHGEDVYNRFRDDVIRALIHCDDSRLALLKHNNFSGVPTYINTMHWYAGFESLSSVVLYFFDHCIDKSCIQGGRWGINSYEYK